MGLLDVGCKAFHNTGLGFKARNFMAAFRGCIHIGENPYARSQMAELQVNEAWLLQIWQEPFNANKIQLRLLLRTASLLQQSVFVC